MVPADDLVGWEECWSGSYKDDGPELATLYEQCSRANLMLACRETGASEFIVLAHAPRDDVFTTTSGNETHLANGVEWYRNLGAWGFAKLGDTIMAIPCDAQRGPDRLCFHVSSGSLEPGYRCGADEGTAFGDYERVILHAD